MANDNNDHKVNILTPWLTCEGWSSGIYPAYTVSSCSTPRRWTSYRLRSPGFPGNWYQIGPAAHCLQVKHRWWRLMKQPSLLGRKLPKSFTGGIFLENIICICITYGSWTLKHHTIWSFILNIPVSLGQYHGCWYPGEARNKGINSNGIDLIYTRMFPSQCKKGLYSIPQMRRVLLQIDW